MKKGLVIITFILGFSFTNSTPAKEISSFLVSSYIRSILYIDKGDYRKALEELEKVKRLDPSSGYIRLKLGYVLLKLGEKVKAEQAFKKAKELDPDNLEASTALIFLYSQEKREKELEEEYHYFLEKAHKLQPENIKISEYLGQFYFYKDMPKEAIKIYQTVVNQRPDYAPGYFWLGYFYEKLNQPDKAIKMWEKTLELNPNHSDALNALGYLYAEEGINLDKAEALVKKALENDPNNGAYLDSLGWVYFKKKDYKKAEEYLLKAINYLKEAVIYEHLGDLYIRLKDTRKALDYYHQAYKLNPKEALKEKIKKYEKQNKGAEEESK